ncbi:F-box protein PP2-A13-like isoform X1 [Primulina huaijiensis]|uniref:F-box protein PP2-A13-like isoform X1 n=1 Tax=Primulina huaijiensis TaxID=1492673 RepID=UPI003CC74464
MGAGLSGPETERTCDSVNLPNRPAGLGDLPENCIASILSCLEASEICKFSCLNKAFLQASLSDTVWEPKLPENHRILAKKLIREYSENLTSKKEIYTSLSNPSRFDGDTKEIWLDKRRRGICVAISWKGLRITGIDDRRYWSHVSTDDSRFHTIAYLRQIWWLEAEGSLDLEFPIGTYSLFFRLRLGRPSNRLFGSRRSICNKAEKIHGWNIKPVQFQVASSNVHHAKSQCFLEEEGKWTFHHVGDFVVENSHTVTKLRFSMTQIDCTHTKGGLCLDCAFICPSVGSHAERSSLETPNSDLEDSNYTCQVPLDTSPL